MNKESTERYNPRVSICVPVRNGVRFFSDMIQSVRKQCFQQYEVILVDDDSSDGSRELETTWAEEDPRVQVFEGPGKGLYPGWNACLDHAKGDYILFLPCDDTLLPHCLEIAVAALDGHPELDLCAYGVDVIDESGNRVSTLAERNWIWKCLGEMAGRRHIRTGRSEIQRMFWLCRSAITSMTGLLIRRELFEKAGRFPTHLGGAGDWAWHLEALRHSDLLHLPEVLATWRVHKGQVTEASASGPNPKELQVFESWAVSHPGEMTPPMRAGLKRRSAWIRFWKLNHSVFIRFLIFPELVWRRMCRKLKLTAQRVLPDEFPAWHPLLLEGIRKSENPTNYSQN